MRSKSDERIDRLVKAIAEAVAPKYLCGKVLWHQWVYIPDEPPASKKTYKCKRCGEYGYIPPKPDGNFVSREHVVGVYDKDE